LSAEAPAAAPRLRNPLDLAGKVGLVTGVANDRSIAYGCARAARCAGADLVITHLDARSTPWVAPVARALDVERMTLDIADDAQLDAVLHHIEERWGKLDFVLHAMAFAAKEDLHGRVADCSRGGFARMMDVSVHSFLRLANRAEPLMRDGGTLVTLSYLGAEKVVPHYNVMGLAKAALEAATRYLAAEMAPAGIRVHALSPGPVATRSASGIGRFDELLRREQAHTPMGRLADIEDIGDAFLYLVSDAAAATTGSVLFVDGGRHIMV